MASGGDDLYELSVLGANSSLDDDAALGGTDDHRDLNSLHFNMHFMPVRFHLEAWLACLWIAVGLPGNLVAFFVWSRPKMRHSSGVYLAALALNDFTFLLTTIPYTVEMRFYAGNVISQPIVCNLFTIVFYTTQYLSPLLVLGFTIERYVSICHPFLREQICTTKRALLVSSLMALLCFALGCVQIYMWTYSDDGGCDVRSEVKQPLIGTISFWELWIYVSESATFLVVPVVVLLLNLRVIIEVRRLAGDEIYQLNISRRNDSPSPDHRKSIQMQRHHHKDQRNTRSATTFMLLAVSFYLIITTLPVTIPYSLYTLFPAGNITLPDSVIYTDSTWQHHFVYNTAKSAIEMFAMSHFAVNIFIYLLTGKVFRTELCAMVEQVCCKERYRQRRRDEMRQQMVHLLPADRSTMTTKTGTHSPNAFGSRHSTMGAAGAQRPNMAFSLQSPARPTAQSPPVAAAATHTNSTLL